MGKLYRLWITIKYQYYRLYWKISPPKQTCSKFYGWHEEHYSVLDQEAVGIGVIDDKI